MPTNRLCRVGTACQRALLLLVCAVAVAGEDPGGVVEQDWLRQAQSRDALRRGVPRGREVATRSDAAGAVDGIKDGTHALKLAPPQTDGPLPFPTGEVLERGKRLAADLARMGLDTAPFEHELSALAGQWAQLPAEAPEATGRQLYFAARRTVRRLAFANPLLRFDRLLFVKRFTQQTYPDICLNHMLWVSRPGGDLCVLRDPFADGSAEKPVREILAGRLGPGHVHGMDLWWDADRIVFGYARKESSDPPIRPWPPAPWWSFRGRPV